MLPPAKQAWDYLLVAVTIVGDSTHVVIHGEFFRAANISLSEICQVRSVVRRESNVGLTALDEVVPEIEVLRVCRRIVYWDFDEILGRVSIILI